MLISSRFCTFSFPCFIVLAGIAGCSSSSTTTQGTQPSPDGGDPATCNKPPATGYTQVVPPSGMQNVDVGLHTAMALSKDGYPVIAYYVNDSYPMHELRTRRGARIAATCRCGRTKRAKSTSTPRAAPRSDRPRVRERGGRGAPV